VFRSGYRFHGRRIRGPETSLHPQAFNRHVESDPGAILEAIGDCLGWYRDRHWNLFNRVYSTPAVSDSPVARVILNEPGFFGAHFFQPIRIQS
jgi:hypothetical protein